MYLLSMLKIHNSNAATKFAPQFIGSESPCRLRGVSTLTTEPAGFPVGAQATQSRPSRPTVMNLLPQHPYRLLDGVGSVSFTPNLHRVRKCRKV